MTASIEQDEKRRKVRVTAILLGLAAVSFYFGFIVIGALRG